MNIYSLDSRRLELLLSLADRSNLRVGVDDRGDRVIVDGSVLSCDGLRHVNTLLPAQGDLVS